MLKAIFSSHYTTEMLNNFKTNSLILNLAKVSKYTVTLNVYKTVYKHKDLYQ